jgi:hypothetical protein
MTLVALLKARGCHPQGAGKYTSPVDAIIRLADSLLKEPCIAMNPGPVIAKVADTLVNIEDIILDNDPIARSPESWQVYERPLACAIEKATLKPFLGNEFVDPKKPVYTKAKPMKNHQIAASDDSWKAPWGSCLSEFGTPEIKLPQRLPYVMSFGLQMLTQLLKEQASFERRLDDDVEERLILLSRGIIKVYKKILKQDVMAFCAAVHAAIQPSERFYEFFELEDDKNLMFYCVEALRPRSERKISRPPRQLSSGSVAVESWSTTSSF